MRLLAASLVGSVLLCACGGGGDALAPVVDAGGSDASTDASVDAAPDAAPAARLAFEAATVDLGQVVSPDSTEGTVELRNVGDAPATGLQLGFEHPPDGGFRLDASGCPPRLDPGAGCPVRIQFVPTIAGQAVADLHATSDATAEVARVRIHVEAVIELSVARTGAGRVTGLVPWFGPSIDCGEICRAPYYGSPAVLHARPLDGSYFDGFTRSCTGQVCTTPVRVGAEVGARFVRPAVRVSWSERARLSTRDLALTSDGGTVVAAIEPRAGSFPPTDGVILGSAPDGAARWTHVRTHEETAAYAADARYQHVLVNDLALDRDGNTLVAGKVCMSGESCTRCATSCVSWLRKLSPTGAPLWTWEASGPHDGQIGDLRDAVDVDADGNVYLATSIGDRTSADLWVRALGPDGTLRWQATYDGLPYQFSEGRDYARDVVAADDGGVWVLGRIATGQLDSDHHATRAGWLARYDAAGARTWSGWLPDAQRLARAPGGGVYVLVADGLGATTVERRAVDGSLVWTGSHRFEPAPMGTSFSSGTALAAAPDGGVVVTAVVHWSSPSENWTELGLVGFGPDGAVRWARRQARPGAPGPYTMWASAVACDASGRIVTTGGELDDGLREGRSVLTAYAP